MLPGIHGLEVARQISDRSRVIFITSYREHAVEAFDVNAVHYLVKPVTEERLFRALDRAVNQTEKVDNQALTIIKNGKTPCLAGTSRQTAPTAATTAAGRARCCAPCAAP